MPLSLSRIDKSGQGETANDWSARQNANMTLIENAVNANESAIQANAFFDNVAAMVATSPIDGTIVQTAGYTSASDGGGNTYKYNATGRPTADGGFYLDGPGADDYFEAIDRTVANVRKFGCIGDGTTENTLPLRACLDAAVTAGVPVYVPVGTYKADLDWQSPVADGDIMIIGECPHRSILLGELADLGAAIIPPANFTGRLYLRNVTFENYYRTLNFTTWLTGPATTISDIDVQDCRFVHPKDQEPGAVVGHFYFTSTQYQNHVVDRCNIRNNYLQMKTTAATSSQRHFNSGCSFNVLLIEGNDFVGGGQMINWIPTVTEPGTCNEQVPNVRIVNNTFRDRVSGGSTCVAIYLSANAPLVSGNTFVDIRNGGNYTTNYVLYLQSDKGRYTDNSFVNCMQGDNQASIYFKGTNTGFRKISRVSRTGNVATVLVNVPHDLATSDTVDIAGVVTADFNATGVTVTVVDDYTFTYPNTGADVGNTYERDGRIWKDGIGARSGSLPVFSGNSFHQDDYSDEWGSCFYMYERCNVINNVFEGLYNEQANQSLIETWFEDSGYRIAHNLFDNCCCSRYINIRTACDDVDIVYNSMKNHQNGPTAYFIMLSGADNTNGAYNRIRIHGNSCQDNHSSVVWMIYLGLVNPVTVNNIDVTDNFMANADASDLLFGTSSGANVLKNIRFTGNRYDGPSIQQRDMFSVAGSSTVEGYTVFRDNICTDGKGPTYTGANSHRPFIKNAQCDMNGGSYTLTVGTGALYGLPVGFMESICHAGGAGTLTVSVSNHVTSDPEVFTLASPGDQLDLRWNGTAWTTAELIGGAIVAP